MTPNEARKRIMGDEWRAYVQERLTRTEDLIEKSKARIADHAAAMERIACNGSLPLYAMSRDLHRNLKEGLKLLANHRAMLVRELQFIERRKVVEAGDRDRIEWLARTTAGSSQTTEARLTRPGLRPARSVQPFPSTPRRPSAGGSPR